MELQVINQYTRDDQKIHIYSQAFLNNLKAVKTLCKPETKLCAVIKANGYGHGIREIVKILKQGQVDFFAVANVYEAAYIADIVGEAKILVLEPVHTSYSPEAVRLCAAKGIHCAIVDVEALKFVQDCLKDSNDILNVHIKVETGMGRCGIDAKKAAQLIKKIQTLKNLRLAGVYTHFSTAAEKNLTYAEYQLQNFQTFLSSQSLLACKDVIIHSANSAAMLNMPQAHFDMVRCGIALFGWVEHPDLLKIKLEPAMKFEVPVVQLNHYKKGQPIGYGRTFSAWRDIVGAIVPIGYADNYWRVYSNNAFMKVGDKFAQVIGRVSMDKTIIDVTDIPDVKVGQYVTVIDNDPQSLCSVYRQAEMADTICHEVLTSLPARALRIIH
ncbi:MAG: alanine racemase [Planctomycetes bacterium GWF2_41_51]|nr:MAG: alanine racemase [Planctomycetes bacterium GWF2_41_51]HBG27026.1 alanine racemase [Phycisphaerales bacterium]